MAEESGSIRVVVSLGGYARSWRAEFDLDAGVIVRAGDLARVGAEPITPAALARLRARARRAHAQGPLRVREQFATGGARFELTVDGDTVTLDFETEGGGRYPRVQAIYDFIER